jgi:hypothetical protein
VHPDIQSRLQDEINTTLKEGEGNLTYEAVSSMKYLDMVVSGMVTSPYQKKWLGLKTTVFFDTSVVQWLVCLPLDPRVVRSNPAKTMDV